MLGMTDVESPYNIAASFLIWNNNHSLSYRAQRAYLYGNSIFNLQSSIFNLIPDLSVTKAPVSTEMFVFFCNNRTIILFNSQIFRTFVG